MKLNLAIMDWPTCGFHSDIHCCLSPQFYPTEGESKAQSTRAISCYKAFFFAPFESRLHWTHSAFSHLHKPKGKLQKPEIHSGPKQGLGFLCIRYKYIFHLSIILSSQFQCFFHFVNVLEVLFGLLVQQNSKHLALSHKIILDSLTNRYHGFSP